LGIAKSGTIILAYHEQGSYDADGKFAPGLKNVDMHITRSHDGGITWTEPHLLNFEPLKPHSAYGKIVTMPEGKLLMPMYGQATGVLDCESGVQSQSGCLSYLLRSTDEGLTWGDPSVVGTDLNEAAYLLLPDGDLLGAHRSNDPEQSLYACRSSDDGYTWTKPQRIAGPREHPADLISLSNDHILLTFGHRHPPYGVQGMISRDGGHTWGEKRLLFCDDRPGKDCGYPSSARLPNGRIITTYYSAGDHQDLYRGDGAFAKAVIYEESQVLKNL